MHVKTVRPTRQFRDRTDLLKTGFGKRDLKNGIQKWDSEKRDSKKTGFGKLGFGTGFGKRDSEKRDLERDSENGIQNGIWKTGFGRRIVGFGKWDHICLCSAVATPELQAHQHTPGLAHGHRCSSVRSI
jgi:hypothetical protein